MTDKKELKKRYKEYVPPMGIFQIKNSVNGKIFIGSGRNLPAQLNSLRFQLKHGLHRNRELQEDYARVGEEKFLFEILDRLDMKSTPGYDPADDLAALEAMWLDKLQPFGAKGYNWKKTSPTRQS